MPADHFWLGLILPTYRGNIVFCFQELDAMATDTGQLAQPSAAVPTGPEPVIETRNLSKTYRDFWGRQKVRALKAHGFDDLPRRDLRAAGP